MFLNEELLISKKFFPSDIMFKLIDLLKVANK